METTGDVINAADVDIDTLQLGVDSREIVFDSRTDIRRLVVALAAQTRHRLLLHTHDLEPAVFDQEPFLAAVQDMIRSHHGSSFHILLQDGRSAVECGSRLIELSRRLSSRIQIRRPAAEHLGVGKTFLLADSSGYLHRPFYSRYEGTASFHNPGTTRRLQRYFMDVWEHGQPDGEMQRLHL